MTDTISDDGKQERTAQGANRRGLTREEAIDHVAEEAAKFVAGLRPYERMNGSCINWAKIKEQGFPSLAAWFKHHWTVHPTTFPTRAVELAMREETTA